MTFTSYSGDSSDNFNDFTALLRSGRRNCTLASSAPHETTVLKQQQCPSFISRPLPATVPPSAAESDLEAQRPAANHCPTSDEVNLTQAMTVAWRSVFAPIAPMLIEIAAPPVEPAVKSSNLHACSHPPLATRSPKNGMTVPSEVKTHSPNRSVSEGAACPMPLQSLLLRERRFNVASSAVERSTSSSSYSASNGASFHLVESPHSSPSSSRFFLDTATTSGTLSPSPAATAANVVAALEPATTSLRAGVSAIERGTGPAPTADDGAATPFVISKMRSESRATFVDRVPAAPVATLIRHPSMSMSRSPSATAPNVAENAFLAARSFSYEGQTIQTASDSSQHQTGGYGMASCLHRIAAAVEASVEEDARVARRRADAANAAAASARSLHHDLSRVRWGRL